MAGQREAHRADVEWLQARLEEYVRVACPACGADDPRPAFEKWSFTYATCEACETLYMNPRPTPAVLDEFYATSRNYAYWNEHVFPASEESRRLRIFAPRAARVGEFCKRYGTATRTLLEVGAGFGTFCDEVGRLGMFERVVAVEPTPGLAETCRARGLEVIESPIEHVALDAGSIDVVASFETIEHLFSPRDLIERCATLLAPNGLLVLTCPNWKGFDLLVLRELSETVDNEHLNYFTPSSLAQLVSSCGLDVLETLTPGALDAELVRKHVLDGSLNLSNQPFLGHVLVDAWESVGDRFQSFLADSGLSSHLWLVARKRGS
jgi:2-polyprenyl-3-methyl-5-hydroxy-6-metoxy-1,4-benzoquinol methylase